jgi:hypothetical protein
MYAVSTNVAPIMQRLSCQEQTANTINTAMKNLVQRGSVGARPFGAQRGFDIATFIEEAQDPLYRSVDPATLATMLRAAWLEGIQTADRLIVELHSDVCEDECRTCGADDLRNGSDECPVCGSDDIKHMVRVAVEGPFAALWAEADPFVLGKAWETEGDDYAEFDIEDTDELVDDLEGEFGFKLDKSNYEEA